jgi:hypothetical protein
VGVIVRAKLGPVNERRVEFADVSAARLANEYHREPEMSNVVIPSAARNLFANAARCFAMLGMTTFNHFRSHEQPRTDRNAT